MSSVLLGNRDEEENGSQEDYSLSIGAFLQLPKLLCSREGGELISRILICCLFGLALRKTHLKSLCLLGYYLKTLKSASVVGNKAPIEAAASSGE